MSQLTKHVKKCATRVKVAHAVVTHLDLLVKRRPIVIVMIAVLRRKMTATVIIVNIVIGTSTINVLVIAVPNVHPSIAPPINAPLIFAPPINARHIIHLMVI